MSAWEAGDEPEPAGADAVRVGAALLRWELRRWREERGLSQDRLGREVNFDGSLIGKVEKAERMPSRELAEACDRVLETGGSLGRVWPLVDQERQRAEAGKAADELVPGPYAGGWLPAEWAGPDTLVVPVLTPREGSSSCPSTAEPCFARCRGGAPVRDFRGSGMVTAYPGDPGAERVDAEIVSYLQRVLDEHGTADNLRGGRHLIEVVAAQMRFVDHLRRDARGEVRNELLTVAARYGEFAGWLHHDAGDARTATYWTDRAMEWAQEAGSHVCVSSILTEKANQAKGQRDADRAIGLARAAQRTIGPLPPRSRAVAMQQEAQGHGLAGDEVACHSLFDGALELLAIAERDQDPGPGRWCTEAHVEIQRATCWLRLERSQQAVDLFESRLAALPARYHRDRGKYLARQAIAHAANRDPDQAVAVGHKALEIGRETGSARIFVALRRLDASLADWSDRPAVAQLHEALTHPKLRPRSP
ncbi:MAG: helix-turn-helix domain-containing protein [Egibacteraceae bacterium]